MAEDKTSFTFTLINCCNVTLKGNKALGKVIVDYYSHIVASLCNANYFNLCSY